MKILQKLENKELAASLKEEIMKARNELRCAEKDIKTATGRLEFALHVVNELEKRD